MTDDDRDDPFGKYVHDTEAPTHSGKDAHYCHAWDGLWICAECEEYRFCTCE